MSTQVICSLYPVSTHKIRIKYILHPYICNYWNKTTLWDNNSGETASQKWWRDWVHQHSILRPTLNWWNTPWDHCSIYSRTEWLGRTDEPNTIYSCKCHVGNVKTSKVFLSWCNGHCCLCYCMKSNLWNQQKGPLPSLLHPICWSHLLPAIWTSGICPHTKGTTRRKVPTTWKEVHHDRIHIWATSLQTPWHRISKCHLQLACHLWWN